MVARKKSRLSGKIRSGEKNLKRFKINTQNQFNALPTELLLSIIGIYD